MSTTYITSDFTPGDFPEVLSYGKKNIYKIINNDYLSTVSSMVSPRDFSTARKSFPLIQKYRGKNIQHFIQKNQRIKLDNLFRHGFCKNKNAHKNQYEFYNDLQQLDNCQFFYVDKSSNASYLFSSSQENIEENTFKSFITSATKLFENKDINKLSNCDIDELSQSYDDYMDALIFVYARKDFMSKYLLSTYQKELVKRSEVFCKVVSTILD